MIWTICRRDLTYFFTTPLAWLVLLAWTALINLIFYFSDLLPALTTPSYSPLYHNSISWGTRILVLLAPALTMNSFAQERNQGTMELLQTVPIREWELLLGKFFSCWLMLMTLVAATLIQIIILFFISSIHAPSLLAGYISYALLCALFASIGVWISLLVDSPIAAYVLTFAMVMLLFLIGLFLSAQGELLNSIGSFIGLNQRLGELISGDMRLGNVFYFICMSLLFLLLAHGALKARRMHG